MTVPLVRSRAQLGIGDSLPVDEPYAFVSESVRRVPSVLDLSGLRATRSHLADRLVDGPYAVSGALRLAPDWNELVRLLPRILGGGSFGGDPPTVTICTLGETIPDFFLTVDRGAGVFTYAGCKIVRATLTAQAGGPLDLLLDVEGLTETVGDAGSFPSLTYVPAPLLGFTASEVSLGGRAREARRVELVVENTARLDRFVNSLTRIDLPVVDRQVRIRCIVDYSADSRELYGNQSLIGPAGIEFFAGSRQLGFAFPLVRWFASSPVVSEGGQLELELQGTAAASASSGEVFVVYTN